MTDSLTRSLTSTKLQRPRVGRGLVPRPRLLEQLNSPHSLTFILAPAGYGKTTLLSTWLETCRVPQAWLSLDEHDNDLAVFVTSLAEALHGMLPAAVDNTRAVLNGPTLPFPEVITASLLNDLAAIQQDFILVLDDYHVIRDQAIHDLLLDLVSYQPRALHLVLASRHDPPLPLARLRAQDNVVELRAPELRLTLEEAALFLREVMALPVDEQTIALLAAKTEGWPVGLRLAALSLRRRPTLNWDAADAFVSNRYVMDYLLAEVLSSLPIPVQEFLIKTSFFDQLSGPLCAAVTGLADRLSNGQPILDWLDHADLFVVPVDEQRHWYRCHHLFRQLLINRLQELYGPTEIAALQLRASAWFAANGYLDEALQHALAARNWAAALQVVMEHRHALMNQSQWQRLDRWVHVFPREVIDEQPHLLLIKVSLKIIWHQINEVPALLDRVEALLARGSFEQSEALQGEVDSRRSALYYWNGDWVRCLSTGSRALEKIPADWWYLCGYTRVFLSNSYLMSGDLTRAYATIYSSDDSAYDQDYQKFLLGCACFLHWNAADLSGLEQAARRVLATSDPADSTEVVTWSRYHLGLYYYQINDLSAAEQQLVPLVMHPHISDIHCFLNSAVLLARIRQLQNQPGEARAIVEAMVSFAFEIGSEAALREARAFQAELALCQGRLAEAGRWAETGGTFAPRPMPYAYIPSLTRAMIFLAQDTLASRQQARQLLAQLDEYFTSIHYTLIRIRVLALQAMLYHAEGAERQALATLEKSIGLAEPGGFIRLFVDLGPKLKPLLEMVARRDSSSMYLVAVCAAYREADDQPLATAALDQTAPDSDRSAATVPIEPLTNREMDVLLLLDKRYSDKEIADALSISAGTVYTHVRHIGDKLGVRGRRAIVQAGKDQGLLA
jgi:LuxR family transcriptional regulator, maltose regulon positive regulatory protein